jgi:enoyl-CoA hydratase/carnithine racemase
MLFTGEAINAEEALKHGLVSEISPAEKLEDRVDEIASQINSNSKSVIALGI